ncbi:AAA family ATPase [Microbispora sp. SCL1-1]|uniref:HelD family protein n=1 Tax=unclassified Microbispora TaxID=2614687 RepID=UPI0011595F4B|nr:MULTISPECIES: AAA family ATPase [unclassified Microbispora]NJP24305.1 AAA family ATPase [Microbispora sp. CL1-1]TQS15095.1 AAA family ATPase [Microbispora sp. SCL1-1]
MTSLKEEQAYVERCREGLRRMLDGARHNVVIGETVAGDRYSAERLGRHLKSLAKDLGEDDGGPPFFGRLDFGPDVGEHAGQRYYIGRRHVSATDGGRPLVIDWRAPVSRTFYQASARDPRGVAVRRRFGWAGGELTGFEDEHLDRRRGHDPGGASRILTAEIERPRVGPMRDIVATIQPEQDDLVRADLEESLCVQGGPGTGKTAVGLHRAAYLLYAHRKRTARGGVLVLGPNRAFLGYISAVLPALGEVDVEQTTLDALLARVPVKATDSAEAAVVKHDARMAEVLRRALHRHIGVPSEPLAVADGSARWRVSRDELRYVVEETRREAMPYGVGRERVIARVASLVRTRAEARGRMIDTAWTRRTTRAVTAAVDGFWPAVRPEEVLCEVLGDCTEAADGVLTTAEQAAITWARPPRTYRSAAWTAADLVLLDELAGLIERPRGYGHVIVDEAQDLSPMQCRAVARRSVHGSLTVLGDLAQGTTPWAARDWGVQMAHLGKPDAAIMSLTVGFRTPAAVVELANRLLAQLAVDVPPSRSFRRDGRLRVLPGDDTAVVTAVSEALGHEGSIGVIAADASAARLRAALTGAGLTVAEGLTPDPSVRVSVVPATLCKGLEYDHVVLAEPAEIVAAEQRGPARLYVALTRAVSRLDVVHARPLPIPLAGETLAEDAGSPA